MMKMTANNRLVIAVLAIVALAIGFWMLLLSPKRDEATKLDAQVEQVETALAQHRSEVSEALEARKEFSADYEHLVVLGKAVPGDDDTASLLVQLNRIADGAGVSFRTLALASEGATTATAAAPETSAPEAAGSTAALPSPTEVAASTLPLGAAIGPAGLGVMPYTLTFEGRFFEIADFIRGLDTLVETRNAKVAVDGRLITINGFSLNPDQGLGFPTLEASFSVTTYLTPPEEGVVGGATSETPGAPALASATVEGTP
jgi:Tfp pilus assembly protein PilO